MHALCHLAMSARAMWSNSCTCRRSTHHFLKHRSLREREREARVSSRNWLVCLFDRAARRPLFAGRSKGGRLGVQRDAAGWGRLVFAHLRVPKCVSVRPPGSLIAPCGRISTLLGSISPCLGNNGLLIFFSDQDTQGCRAGSAARQSDQETRGFATDMWTAGSTDPNLTARLALALAPHTTHTN